MKPADLRDGHDATIVRRGDRATDRRVFIHPTTGPKERGSGSPLEGSPSVSSTDSLKKRSSTLWRVRTTRRLLTMLKENRACPFMTEILETPVRVGCIDLNDADESWQSVTADGSGR
jgi:hypothetical protein